MTARRTADEIPQGDALSRALIRQRPELAGRVHYVGGEPWCDGINHTTMCSDDAWRAADERDGDE